MTSLLHFWIITSISHKLSIRGLSELHLFPLAILVQNQLSLEQNINICERNEDIKFVTRARAHVLISSTFNDFSWKFFHHPVALMC